MIKIAVLDHERGSIIAISVDEDNSDAVSCTFNPKVSNLFLSRSGHRELGLFCKVSVES